MTPKEYLTKKTFCALPWKGVYIQPDGLVQNCAVINEPLGDINVQSLESILNGPVNQNVKQDMLDGVFANRCNHCHQIEKNQQNSLDRVSNRVWYLKTLHQVGEDLHFFDDPSNFKLKMLDLRWQNTCNFACIYCSPELSSSWANELNLPPYISGDALKESLEYINKNLDSVDHVYLAGGEPLLIKENLPLLTKLYELKPEVEIRINTNLSVINNNIYNLIKQFKNVHWTVSIDGIGDEFEYVRYGGKWRVFLKNLECLRKDFKKINFNSTWCILTAHGVLDCIDFLQNLGFHENTFIVNPLDSPAEWHVCHLPELAINKLQERIKSKLGTANPQYALYNSLSLMLNYLNTPWNKNIESTFNALKEIDQRRRIDSSKIFIELYKLKEGN